ncbi:MAG: hypothetical protein ACOVOV_17320, partial [Dolichospermum sp.]
NVGTLDFNQGIGFSVTIKYPAGTFPVGTSVTNVATATAVPLGASTINGGPAAATSTIAAPNCDVRFGFRGDQTSSRVTANANPQSNYGQGNVITAEIGNSSNVSAFGDIILDIPNSLYPLWFNVYNNTPSTGWTAEYKTNLNGSWRPIGITNFNTPYSGSRVNVSSLGLASNEYVTQIHFFSANAIVPNGGGSFTYGFDFTGVDRNGNSVPVGTTIPLTMQTANTCNSGGFGAVGGPTYTTINQGLNVTPPHTSAQLNKSVNPTAAIPGAIVDYNLAWDLDEINSSSPPVNAIFSDLLPAGMEYVPNTSLDNNNNPITATVTVIDNYNGTGRQLVRWNFTGVYGGNAY